MKSHNNVLCHFTRFYWSIVVRKKTFVGLTYLWHQSCYKNHDIWVCLYLLTFTYKILCNQSKNEGCRGGGWGGSYHGGFLSLRTRLKFLSGLLVRCARLSVLVHSILVAHMTSRSPLINGPTVISENILKAY